MRCPKAKCRLSHTLESLQRWLQTYRTKVCQTRRIVPLLLCWAGMELAKWPLAAQDVLMKFEQVDADVLHSFSAVLLTVSPQTTVQATGHPLKHPFHDSGLTQFLHHKKCRTIEAQIPPSFSLS